MDSEQNEQENEVHGIKETKEVVMLLLSLIEAVVSSFDDGKINLTDLFRFYGALRDAGPALKDIGKVREEIMDLSDNEKSELETFIIEEFNIENDIVEAYIEKALQASLLILDLIRPSMSK